MDFPIQVESLGRLHHAIAGYQIKNRNSYEWQSHVHFGTRYNIAFSINVMLNEDHTKVVKILGKPQFHLHIYEKITKVGTGAGGFESSFDGQVNFGEKEWREMMKVKGDIGKMLAVLNIKENKNDLPLFKEMVENSLPVIHQRIQLGKK